LARAVQAVVEEPVQFAFVYQGYTLDKAGEKAAQVAIQLQVVTHLEPSAALSYWRGAGWWSGCLAGRRESAD